MSSRRIRTAIKGILGSRSPKLYDNVRSLHDFFNLSVYNFLNHYKFPDIVFPIEEAVTRNLINDLIPIKDNVKYFNRVMPEVFTGSDLLLILRGNYQGKKKEFKVLYQAKNTKWKNGEPCLELDRSLKLRGTAEHISQVQSKHPNLRFYWNRRWVWTKSYFQHEALYNFSKIIKAEPLYLMYRYRISEKVDKDRAISFIFCRHLLETFIRVNIPTSKFTFSEKELCEAVFFPECESELKTLISGKGGFLFFGSNLEETYRFYRSLFSKYSENVNPDLKPVELQDVGENNYELIRIQKELPDADVEDIVGIYESGKEHYSFHVKNSNSGLPLAAPESLIIWDID